MKSYPVSLEFHSARIERGHTHNFMVRPPNPFKMRYVEVDEKVAEALEVVDFRVGHYSQTASMAPAQLTMFLEPNTEKYRLGFDTCQANDSITLVLRNTSDHDVEFSGKLCGTERR